MKAALGNKGLEIDDARAVIAFEENSRRYEARNPRRVRVLGYRVDGALLTGGTQKACDYLLGVPSQDRVVLIELKGQDLRRAARQIESTLQRLSKALAGHQVDGRVILSRVAIPNVRSSVVINVERFLAKTGGSFLYRTAVFVEAIS